MCNCVAQYPGTTREIRSLVLSLASAFPRSTASRLLHHLLRGLLSIYSHYGLQTRPVASATLYTGGFSLHRRLQPFRFLHDCSDCSDCSRVERTSSRVICTHCGSAPFTAHAEVRLDAGGRCMAYKRPDIIIAFDKGAFARFQVGFECAVFDFH